MLRLLKFLLTALLGIGICTLSFAYYSVSKNSNNGVQTLEIWNNEIDKNGYIDLIGRLNDDHMLQATKVAKIKEYTNLHKDLLTAIFTVPEEKRELPYMYEKLIEEKKRKLEGYQLNKSLKFNKTNNMVKFRVTTKAEMRQINNSGIFFDIFQPHYYSTTTGPTSTVVSSQAAWSRDAGDASFPDTGVKQEGNNNIIAIIDTGVENVHPYLLDKVKYEACFQDNEDEEDCKYGDTGKNAATPCPSKFGQCYHGTMMAGIAAGNGKAIKQENNGIAKNANIFAIQAFSTYSDDKICGGPDDCTFTTEAEYSQALDLVHIYNLFRKTFTLIPNPPFQLPLMSAVNMSFGSGVFMNSCDGLAALKDVQTDIWELRYTYDVPTVISAGNGFGSTNIGANGVGSPACLSDGFTVSATDNASNGATTLTGFSNGANNLTDISAPGALTFSSLSEQKFTPQEGRLGGTSGAAAHVSGAFSLMSEVFPNEKFKVEHRFKVLNDVAIPFAYANFAGVFTNPLPPNNTVGVGPVAGTSRRLFLCKDYQRTGTGDAGVDAPFNQGVWQCKTPPIFDSPKSPPFNSDLFKILRMNCEYCPVTKKF